MRKRKHQKKQKKGYRKTKRLKPIDVKRRDARLAELTADAEFRWRYHQLRMQCLTESRE